MVATNERPTKQQEREFARWRRILRLHQAGRSKEEIAQLEDVGAEQIRRLIHAAERARRKGWI